VREPGLTSPTGSAVTVVQFGARPSAWHDCSRSMVAVSGADKEKPTQARRTASPGVTSRTHAVPMRDLNAASAGPDSDAADGTAGLPTVTPPRLASAHAATEVDDHRAGECSRPFTAGRSCRGACARLRSTGAPRDQHSVSCSLRAARTSLCGSRPSV
jgi:hypothetical protein